MQAITGRYSKTALLSNDELLALVNSQWENFKKFNNRYPTSQEIDESLEMLPTKTIQRRLGGIKKCRETLNHSILNYSQGETRAITASNSITQSVNDENELQGFLVTLFGGRPKVCRQEPYVEFKNNIRSDFGIYHKEGHFFVDVFTAKDKWSLVGCINHKQKKLIGLDIKDTIYYVANNTNQTVIDYIVKNKKNKLPTNVVVISSENFKNYCQTLTPSIHL